MTRSRLIAAVLALLLAAPASALAQGAGDDQYEDPLGGQPSQTQNGGDSGLSQEPPGGGDPSGGGSSGGDAGAGGDGTGADPGAGGAGEEASGTAADDQLPNTGSEPFTLAALGAALLLVGGGLRLRTIDPNGF